MSELWPRLGLPAGELDYLVGQYDAQWFRDMAKLIESGQSLPAAARCFLQLAQTPNAIKALNDHPNAPREIMGLNRAAHYVARLELRGEDQKKEVRHEIAMAWGGMADETIRDDVVDFGKEAQMLIDRLVSQWSHGDRRGFVKAFDADMDHRALRMRKK